MSVDILAFAAHPDDVELTMGGTMLRLKQQGYSTGIIDFTRGELSTKGTVETRQKETDDASEILQLDVRENLNLGDGIFKENEENRQRIMDCIRKYTPKIIFAPYKTDRHPDHERCSRMVREAHFYSGLKHYKTNYSHYRANHLYYYMANTVFEPSFIFDVTDTFEGRIQLIKAYKSQFFNPEKKDDEVTPISRPEFLEYIRARARFYGEKSGVLYGEAFYTESIPRYTDFPEL